MSGLVHTDEVVTKAELAEFYQKILPYLGGGRTYVGFTPIGTIISVMGNHAPTNYLACDGSVVNISDYPELAAYFNTEFGSINHFGGDGTTTFAVPDLRGEFLRGTGTNSHTDSGDGANVGVHQDATGYRVPLYSSDLKKQYTRFTNSEHTSSDWKTNFINSDRNIYTPSGETTYTSDVTATTSSGSVNQSLFSTVRPTNTSILYCIAVRDTYSIPADNYSSTERVIGTWIDGKPLYQKTLLLNRPTWPSGQAEKTTSVQIDTPIGAPVDIFVSCKIMMLNTSIGEAYPHDEFLFTGGVVTTSTWPVNAAQILLRNHACTLGSTDVIVLKVNNAGYCATNYKHYVTIQYTKTTD